MKNISYFINQIFFLAPIVKLCNNDWWLFSEFKWILVNSHFKIFLLKMQWLIDNKCFCCYFKVFSIFKCYFEAITITLKFIWIFIIKYIYLSYFDAFLLKYFFYLSKLSLFRNLINYEIVLRLLNILCFIFWKSLNILVDVIIHLRNF